MINKIFVMIKPWNMQYSEEILAKLDKVGKRLETKAIESIPREPIVIQHSKYQKEPFFQLLIDDLAGKPCVIGLYTGTQNEFDKQKSILREIFGKNIPPLLLFKEMLSTFHAHNKNLKETIMLGRNT